MAGEQNVKPDEIGAWRNCLDDNWRLCFPSFAGIRRGIRCDANIHRRRRHVRDRMRHVFRQETAQNTIVPSDQSADIQTRPIDGSKKLFLVTGTPWKTPRTKLRVLWDPAFPPIP